MSNTPLPLSKLINSQLKALFVLLSVLILKLPIDINVV